MAYSATLWLSWILTTFILLTTGLKKKPLSLTLNVTGRLLNSFMMSLMQPLLQARFEEPGLCRMGHNSYREKHHCISTPTI